MELKGKKIAVLVENLYQDQEVWYPIYRLREAGATVVTVGTGGKLYKSKHGYEVKADKDAGDVQAENFDGVIVPGGYAPNFQPLFGKSRVESCAGSQAGSPRQL